MSRTTGVDAEHEVAATTSRPRTVPSIARAVRVLEEVAAADRALSLSTLSRALGIPKSTAYAVCNTLVETNMLERTDAGLYRLGHRVVTLSRGYLRHTHLVQEFRRICAERRMLRGETIVLSVLDGADVTYIAVEKGDRLVGIQYDVGMTMPANCSATGKSLLAALPEDEVRRRHGAGAPLRSLTDHSINDLDTLLEELRIVGGRGWAIDDEETTDGMICVGAPIMRAPMDCVAAIAASFVKATVDSSRLEEITSETRGLAATLSERLFGPALRERSGS